MDEKQFNFKDAETAAKKGWGDDDDEDYGSYSDDDFTAFYDTKIDEDEPVDGQLKKQLKKLLYSKMRKAILKIVLSFNSFKAVSAIRKAIVGSFFSQSWAREIS